MVDTPLSRVPAASALVGSELVLISQLSTTVTKTAATISAQASDNSFNDSGSGFVAAGFAVDDYVHVSGFTGNVANNIASAKITALTAGKMTIGGTDGDVIVDDAAGESVTISKWVSRRSTKAAQSGARVKKTTGLTGLNFTTSTAITFDAEDYDDAAYHDTGSNTDRLTCTAAGRYDLEASACLSNINASDFVRLSIIRYNSSAVLQEETAGLTVEVSSVAVSPRLNVTAFGVAVAAGDFFRAFLQVEADTSIDFVYAKFAIRRVG